MKQSGGKFPAGWSEAKISLGSSVQMFGATLHRWFLDLALTVEPRLAVVRPLAFRPNPWPALAIIILLVIGIGTFGYGGLVVVREILPGQQREALP